MCGVDHIRSFFPNGKLGQGYARGTIGKACFVMYQRSGGGQPRSNTPSLRTPTPPLLAVFIYGEVGASDVNAVASSSAESDLPLC